MPRIEWGCAMGACTRSRGGGVGLSSCLACKRRLWLCGFSSRLLWQTDVAKDRRICETEGAV